MQGSSLSMYVDMYRNLQPEEVDSQKILYSYNCVRENKVGIVGTKDLLAMFKYIVVNGKEKEYEKEYSRLIYYITHVLGGEFLHLIKNIKD